METELHPLLPTAIMPTARPNARLEDRASFQAFFASLGDTPDVETAVVAAKPDRDVEDPVADHEDGAATAAPDTETSENLTDDDAFERWHELAKEYFDSKAVEEVV